jgi:hypothetical protein
MRRSLVAVILVAVGCSPEETAESSTTSTMEAGTTSIGRATTTSPTATTTSAGVATTTSDPTTSTTTDVLEGDWADEPLVAVAFGALGWWDGSDWVEAEAAGTLPVSGGEDYQVVLLDELGMTSGGPETTVCEPLELIGVELSNPELLGDFPGPYGVAISAPWALQPHLFEEISDDGTYAGFAADLLSSRGLDVADPIIKQLFRTDLEGDGVNEVLVVAEDVSQNFLMEPGDYSIAFMRKAIERQVQTAILAETVALGEGDTFSGAHSFGGVGDLNDDGKMELITDSAFFEGFTVTVWEYLNDDLGPIRALETGCGV